jgi:hypothetical protein
MYAEQNMDTRIAMSVSDRDALRGVNQNSLGQGTLVYNREDGELCIWMDESTAGDVEGVSYVPTFISDLEVYQNDPSLVPGRLLVHSRTSSTGAPVGGAYLPVRAATTANLAATLQDGGYILLANANGALGAIDGVTLAVGDRLVVKNQTAKEANGIFAIVSLGGVSAKYQLIRVPDMFAGAAVLPGMKVLVLEGTISGLKEYAVVATPPVEIGTTDIEFRPLTQESEGALVLGTRTISNLWVTARTFVGIEVKTPAGTMGTHYKVAKTSGNGNGSVVITAVDTSGVLVDTDTSTLVVKLID